MHCLLTRAFTLNPLGEFAKSLEVNAVEERSCV
jgi:hypothetical protein